MRVLRQTALRRWLSLLVVLLMVTACAPTPGKTPNPHPADPAPPAAHEITVGVQIVGPEPKADIVWAIGANGETLTDYTGSDFTATRPAKTGDLTSIDVRARDGRPFLALYCYILDNGVPMMQARPQGGTVQCSLKYFVPM